MNGRNNSLCSPFKYKSSGLLFDVHIIITPLFHNSVNNRRNNIASATSVVREREIRERLKRERKRERERERERLKKDREREYTCHVRYLKFIKT